MDYYAARGWNVSKDIPAVDKVALCRLWKPENVNEILRVNRRPYCDILQAIDAEDDCLITAWLDMRKLPERWWLKYNSVEPYELLNTKYLRGMYNLLPKDDEGKPIAEWRFVLPNTPTSNEFSSYEMRNPA